MNKRHVTKIVLEFHLSQSIYDIADWQAQKDGEKLLAKVREFAEQNRGHVTAARFEFINGETQ